uniref:Uncharacterized protein n=1 Tax=Arundo donax TaxID=35708 RepID=A0A0A9FLV7_ARUDO
MQCHVLMLQITVFKFGLINQITNTKD